MGKATLVGWSGMLSALALSGVAMAAATPEVRLVAASGTPSPDRPSFIASIGTSFGVSNGAVAFAGTTVHTFGPGPYNHGLWVEEHGALREAAFDLDQPAGAIASIFSPGRLWINARGDVASADINVGITASYAQPAAQVATINRHTPAPGTTGNFSLVGRPVITDGGRVVSHATTQPDGNGIWQRGPSGPLQPLALVNDTHPAVGLYLGLHDNVKAAGERVVHSADISWFGSPSRTAIIAHLDGDQELIARQGGPVPGLAGETFLTLSTSFALNERGTILLRGNASATGSAAVLRTPTSAQVVLHAGQPAPGIVGAHVFAPGSFALNNHDRVAVQATLASGAGSALWSNGLSESLELIARSGSAAPLVPGDWLYSGFPHFALTDSGAVAFRTDLTSPDGNEGSHALFMQDLSGQLHLLAHVGQTWEIAPGVPAGVITSIQFADPLHGPAEQAVSGDTIVFRLGFEDGRSGLYVAVVPEPAAMSLLLGSGVLLRRRR